MNPNAAVFPKGTDGLPVYPTRAEAIERIETLTAERDEAIALLRDTVASLDRLYYDRSNNHARDEASRVIKHVRGWILSRLDKAGAR